jgi:hypothetical protein
MRELSGHTESLRPVLGVLRQYAQRRQRHGHRARRTAQRSACAQESLLVLTSIHSREAFLRHSIIFFKERRHSRSPDAAHAPGHSIGRKLPPIDLNVVAGN